MGVGFWPKVERRRIPVVDFGKWIVAAVGGRAPPHQRGHVAHQIVIGHHLRARVRARLVHLHQRHGNTAAACDDKREYEHSRGNLPTRKAVAGHNTTIVA